MCSLTPRCDAYCGARLQGGMHTAAPDSEVGSTLQSLTPWWDAHHGAFWEILITWLSSVMHTAELDLVVRCTLQSQTILKMSVFHVFVFITSFNFWSTVKKIPWTICDLWYYFHINIFRHHREITLVKLGIKMDTSEFTDSSVRCTLRSFLKIEYLGEIETEFENT